MRKCLLKSPTRTILAKHTPETSLLRHHRIHLAAISQTVDLQSQEKHPVASKGVLRREPLGPRQDPRFPKRTEKIPKMSAIRKRMQPEFRSTPQRNEQNPSHIRNLYLANSTQNQSNRRSAENHLIPPGMRESVYASTRARVREKPPAFASNSKKVPTLIDQSSELTCFDKASAFCNLGSCLETQTACMSRFNSKTSSKTCRASRISAMSPLPRLKARSEVSRHTRSAIWGAT
jgi:hypothetical protein